MMVGVVKDQAGNTLQTGYSIEARISNINYATRVYANGLQSAQDNRTHTTVTVGGRTYNYGNLESFQVCADDPASSAVEGGAPGDVISFYVDGVLASSFVNDVQTNITFSRGVASTVDLVTGSGSSVVAD